MGIIQRSNSPWSSPLHLAPKKDNTLRPCGDFRRLNLQTIKDEYPIPHILDLHNDLSNKTIFSRIDLHKGFWQIELHPRDRPKTAIITPRGLFEFVRMPFGLKNAPNTFQRFVDQVFEGIPNIFVYVDDILIASDSDESHQRDLARVLERIRKFNLAASLKKSDFFQRNVNFLGFDIKQGGSSIPEERVSSFLSMQIPKTPRDLQKMLGALNFYRRFIPNYAVVVQPLYTAASSKPHTKPITWNDKTLSAFKTLKHLVANHTSLVFPNTELPTSVATDASNNGIGAVLQQKVNDQWMPIAFFSRSLNPAQRNYSPFDLELLAVFEAIKYFRYYLEGLKHFTVYTDHQPLIGALNKKLTSYSPRQQRHLAFIAEFTNDIQHIKGSDNGLADLLSRSLCSIQCMADLDLARLSELQGSDHALQHMLKKHPQKFKQVQVNDTTVWCLIKSRPIIFVPDAMKLEVFKYIHEQGHPGFRQTKRNIQRTFTWARIHATTKQMAAACVPCNKAKVTRQYRTPLQEFPLPNARFDHVHIDTIGPLPPAPSGHTYALTITDRFTRMPMAIPLRTATAKTTLSQFVSSWVAMFGLPQTITLDNGSIFTGTEWENFAAKFNVKLNFTSTYHPQANGLVERMHRTLKDALTASNKRDWVSQLPWTLLAMRNAAPDEMPYTPAEATFGGATRRPADLTNSAPSVDLNTFTCALLKQHMPKPVPGRWHIKHDKVKPFLPNPQKLPKFVYVRNAQKRPLRDAYSGPFPVQKWYPKTVTIVVNDSPTSVSIDRVKPAQQFEDQFLFYDKERDEAGVFDDDETEPQARITRSKAKLPK